MIQLRENARVPWPNREQFLKSSTTLAGYSPRPQAPDGIVTLPLLDLTAGLHIFYLSRVRLRDAGELVQAEVFCATAIPVNPNPGSNCEPNNREAPAQPGSISKPVAQPRQRLIGPRRHTAT
jgi:hypothetical protein